VQIDGEVKKPLTLDIDRLTKLAPLEERIYRLRCVEGWSMVIPWVGYSLANLIKQVEPTATPNTSNSPPWPTSARCRAWAAGCWNGPTWKACAWTKPCIP
jgi:hypothetical protein